MKTNFWTNVVIALGSLCALTACGRAQSLQDIESWFAQARQAEAAGNYREAVALFHKVMEHGPRIWGARSPNVSATLNNLALNYVHLHEFDKAEKYYKESLEIADFVYGDDAPQYALGLNNLAIVYRKTYRFADAEKLIRQGLKIREKRLGKDHEDVANSLQTLANVYDDFEKFEEAESYHQRALRIMEQKYGRDHAELGDFLHDFAQHYKTRGRYDLAEPLLSRAAAIHEKVHGPNHPQFANTLNSFGNYNKDLGKFDEAEKHYLRALAIFEARLGKEHPSVADPLNNLGILYMEMNQNNRAAEYFHRAMVIREAKFGKDHPLVAASCNNLALVMKQMGLRAEAEKWLLESLRIREKHLGREHTSVAGALSNLGNSYADDRQFEKAEANYRRALSIYESKYGKSHSDVGMVLLNLASIFRDQGQNEKAAEYYQAALATKQSASGFSHLDINNSLYGMAIVQGRMRQFDAALQTMDELRKSTREFVAKSLPLLTVKEQVSFLRTIDSVNLHLGLTLALREPNSTAALAKSAEWLLNSKGSGQEALVQSTLFAKESRDPAAAKILNDLLGVRRELAILAMRAPLKDAEKNHQDRLAALTQREQSLAGQLRQSSGRLSNARWVALPEMRGRIPKDAVYIELARFQPYDLIEKPNDKTWFPARYVAWIIPAVGPIRLIDLGLADEIEKAIQSARAPLEEARKRIMENGEAEAAAEAHANLAALARLIVTPLLPHTGSFERWIISPDAALWLVPWAALPLNDQTYLAEKHAIRLVIGGRDLLADASQNRVQPNPSAIVADPDYDLELPGQNNGDAAANTSRFKRVRSLPGTAIEAAAVAERLETITGVAPSLLSGKDATVGNALKVARPRYFMLATHGFFRPVEELPVSERDRLLRTPEGLKRLPGLEDPLLRCGLMMAGCNSARNLSGAETGILTGREVISADLRGTELVVLSACETAVGDVRLGEGVAGLRQAFQLAGADAVLATLWSVPDLSSARLTARFFDGLAEKLPADEALRAAQRAEIDLRRKRTGAAHPYYWAAYTLTGRVKN